MTPPTFTPAQYRSAAAHWLAMAESEEAAARWEAEHGNPRGDTASYYARSALWREIASGLLRQIGE